MQTDSPDIGPNTVSKKKKVMMQNNEGSSFLGITGMVNTINNKILKKKKSIMAACPKI